MRDIVNQWNREWDAEKILLGRAQDLAEQRTEHLMRSLSWSNLKETLDNLSDDEEALKELAEHFRNDRSLTAARFIRDRIWNDIFQWQLSEAEHEVREN